MTGLNRDRCRCTHPAFAHDPAPTAWCLHPGCPCRGYTPDQKARTSR